MENNYFIHLKGSNTPTLVRGSSLKIQAGYLTVRIGKDIVAQYRTEEIQGWRLKHRLDDVSGMWHVTEETPERFADPIKSKRRSN